MLFVYFNLLWFVRVTRVWPEVCLMTVCLGGLIMYNPKSDRRKFTEAQAETILDAYTTTEREAVEHKPPSRASNRYFPLTPAQREAAALLHDQWRYLVHSVDGLGY